MTRLLAAILLLSTLAVPAVAGPSAERPLPFSASLSELGAPAREEVVDELLAAADVADTPRLAALARALGHAGGRAALSGLEALLDVGADEVRLAVLEAATHVDLRSEALATRVRRLAREEGGAVRAAATTALGIVGDGRDMALLMSLTQSGDADTAKAAYRALKHLTGANVPFVHARWTYYWKSFRRRAGLLLPQTLLVLSMDAGAPDSGALVDIVRLYAMVDLPTVRDQLADWLHEPDLALRTIACRLIADLRLADLGPQVVMALRFASRPELRDEVLRTLEALGIPSDDA